MDIRVLQRVVETRYVKQDDDMITLTGGKRKPYQ